MAASDLFQEFNSRLSDHDRQALTTVIAGKHADLLAARSEEARLRIVQNFIEEVHKLLQNRRKPGR
ncbi:MAG: hypothetical protein KAJ12_12245 [Bacteroidetes bacterium]|nr:hypothetical protein [Bacteroidota bacterium]